MGFLRYTLPSVIAAPPLGFTGSPNVTITAINTSGGIVTSRDSDGSTYQTPFFIQVSASAITATGTSVPYEDLEFKWDFGDPSGSEIFTRPTDGILVNANTDQQNPEAAYVYRNAGPYVITLSIRGKNGAGFTTATVTKSITIAPFGATNTYYIDSTAGGTNAGTLANPFNTMSAVNTAVASGLLAGGSFALLFKRGSHFTGTTGLVIDGEFANAANIRVDAYSTGANPIIEYTANGASLYALAIKANGVSIKDMMISNIVFLNTASTGVGAGSIVLGGIANSALKNFCVDNCIFSVQLDTNGAPFGGAYDDEQLRLLNFGWWKCSFLNLTTSTLVDIGLGGGAGLWNAIVGCYFKGAGVSALSHHIYPDTRDHGLCKWCNFDDGGIGGGVHQRGYCYNGNFDGALNVSTDHVVGNYHCIAENRLYGTIFGVDMGNRTNNSNASDSTMQFFNVVVERNFYFGLRGDQFPCAYGMTLRDNRVTSINSNSPAAATDWFDPRGITQIAGYTGNSHANMRLYRNKIYGAVLGGAIISYPDSGWSAKQVLTDNIIVDPRTSAFSASGQTGARTVWIVSSDWVSAGSLIDRNTYYCSGGDTTYLLAASSEIDFTAWKLLGWDVNGTNLTSNTLGWIIPPTQWSDMN